MLLSIVAPLLLTAASAASDAIVIVNARIADGAGGPLVTGKTLVIQGDQIAAIVDAASYKAPAGARVIDARGMVVAPGFIDMHSHADGQILERPDASTQVRQGITTFLGGQDGGSKLPLGEFLGKLEKKGTAINVASMAGFGTLREQAMGDDNRRPARAEEIAKMKELLDQAMRDGAFGLSSGLEYEPDSFSTTDEIVEVASAVKPYGGFYISHVRDEGSKTIESFRELVTIAERAGIPAQITHIKLGSVSAWGRFQEYAALMKEADAKGLKISADCYPYNFWHSTLRVLVLSRRYDDLGDVKRGVDDNGGPENILLSRYAPDPSIEGKSLAQIAKEKGTDPYTLYMKLIRETDPKTRKPEWGDDVEGILGISMREEDIRSFFADPRVMVSSDGEIDGSHPRGAGTYPRFLARYVREGKVVSLEEGVRRMTSLPASTLGLKDRGRIAAGMKADLVVFDPETVADRSTIKEPTALPVGIPYVIVNGQVAVDSGMPTSVRAGRVLRSAPRNHDLEGLAWLEGRWAGQKDGLEMEEQWTAPRGGALLGLHSDVRAGRLVSWEFFRIDRTAEGTFYFASPRSAPPTPFKLVELGDRRVAFENRQHDFPQRILYWLDAEGSLHAKIEGPHAGKSVSEEWTWTRIP